MSPEPPGAPEGAFPAPDGTAANPLATRPVEPTGTERHRVHVQRATPRGRVCEWRDVDSPTYPRSVEGEELRRLRVHEADLVLREAAKRLGLSPSELSGLERGSLTFVEPGGWELARTLLLTPPP